MADQAAATNRKEIRIQEQPSNTLTGHSGYVNAAIFLSDGRLVSGSVDGTIKVWDTASGKELFTLGRHSSWVSALAILPNGLLASGSVDKTIKIWDLIEKREVRTLQGHTEKIFALNVLKNGNLISCSKDNTIKVWDPNLSENNLLLSFEGHGNVDKVIPVAVLPNDYLVTCSCDDGDHEESVMRVWDPKDGRLVNSYNTELKSAAAVVALSNGQVAIGACRGTIKIIDLQDESKTRVKEWAHPSTISCLLQLSNGNLVSCAQDDDPSSAKPVHAIKLWACSDFTLLQKIVSGHPWWIQAMSVSQDETMLATGGMDSVIKLWQISN